MKIAHRNSTATHIICILIFIIIVFTYSYLDIIINEHINEVIHYRKNTYFYKDLYKISLNFLILFGITVLQIPKYMLHKNDSKTNKNQILLYCLLGIILILSFLIARVFIYMKIIPLRLAAIFINPSISIFGYILLGFALGEIGTILDKEKK